jgi:hypothetical protein
MAVAGLLTEDHTTTVLLCSCVALQANISGANQLLYTTVQTFNLNNVDPGDVRGSGSEI